MASTELLSSSTKVNFVKYRIKLIGSLGLLDYD